MGYLMARLDQALGWLQRLTDSHEQHCLRSEEHRTEVRERLARLETRMEAQMEAAARQQAKPEPRPEPGLAERLKAAKEVLVAGGWLLTAAIGLAKLLNWISPETAARLVEIVQKAH